MNNKVLIAIGVVSLVVIAGLIGLTMVLTPENKGAYNAAVRFINSAGTFDDEAAYALLTPEMQAYVDATCDDGRVSACIADYIPPEWGNLVRDGGAVFRRAIRDGDAFDVQLVATYERDQGFAGVCIYHRVVEIAPDDWRVAAWSGFVSCDEPNSGLNGLRQADAPNRVAP
ncbi:MAG: hypothetical protein EA396_07615 [Anaerolineaceae bacterium]|nr:MAG: hypothetical protein EA396_07615 [Anaerolineaceae bacterium]